MKTALLMGTLTALLLGAAGVLGLYIGGSPVPYLTIALVIAVSINFIAYYKSDQIVLKMYKARVVDETEYPELHRIMRELTTSVGMPMPKIAIVPSENPNAFATGRNEENAVVAVTEGAMSLLDRDELKGVLGHELAHILNRDMFVSTMAAVIAGVIGYLGQLGWWITIMGGIGIIGFILLLVFIPLAATIIRMAISRDREFGADRRGSEITHQPDMLARALIKLQSVSNRRPMKSGNQATSSLFIVHPFKRESLLSLLSTHPPVEKRIERLNELALDMGRSPVSYNTYQ
jgi:heat shock protein HtpX